MWKEIRLQSLGVIADASLELGPGFTVITGETGAGKTMVVTALGLLRGERADSTLVRDGATGSRVEGTVDVSVIPGAAAAAREAGAVLEDDTLILGRTMSSEGRSRAILGGATVPASTLAAVSDLLVAVHGQSDHHRLLRSTTQREALDRFAGESVLSLLAAYRPAYQRLHEVDKQLEDSRRRVQERLREVDLLRFGLAEVAAADPSVGEDDELRAEEDRLANADALRTAAGLAHEALGGDGHSPDAGSQLVAAQRLLDAQRDHDPELAALADRTSEVSVLTTEVAADLARYASSVEVDPTRLSWVQDRRAVLAALVRKYGPTLADVLAWVKAAAPRLAELEDTDVRIEALRTERGQLVERLLSLAQQLSVSRQEAAERLSRLVSAELVELAMPHAVVTVAVRQPPRPEPQQRLGSDGADDVELLLTAHAGAPVLPLSRGASGGELSRVMLALEVVLADTAAVPTFVFDEVDAGIGGRAAIEVGRRLARLAGVAQVIAVTHLPQVAAFATRHYRVRKSDEGTITTSGVQALDEAGRVQELSRMLAGLEGSAAAVAHARELLELGAAERPNHTPWPWQDER